MGFRRRHHSVSTPEINLVPMIDVLMSVLTFFIIISMTLSRQKAIEVQLPQDQLEPVQPITADPKAQFW
ncbi:MAG: hypothetical protein HC934_13530 [Acaryochloridaceae cyanobacterium SU_2_1]|nr:hypothetical protein [Acaryochloridaceae cyanobacterium SU_2_1]